ncbi:uncharacterized protein N7483_011599 [Penicillium malachiteum]|uniref:uncharacterized protein n=1 Tax=Penicillium malachiteum TaxID=1324776 RepID=UPI00254925FA|nr:uncharacterized protein N7483_011599 [Penicillium malachiteum]KAJ5714418.1 hypothetical protein N7483_011599 [Penicillium malachiteum]
MPPQNFNSYVASPSPVSLCEIIKLEPDKEPWCAGYAPSQGRRCHARTNARGRSSAMMLLNEGTKDLRAGRNIDELLEDLALHVLCTRFHQSQASSLANRWKQQVRTYLNSQLATAQPVRLEKHSLRGTFLQSTEENMERLSSFHQRSFGFPRVEVASHSASNIVNPTVHLNSGNARESIISSTGRNVSSRITPSANFEPATVRRHSSISTNQAGISVPRPTRPQVSRQTRAVSVPTTVVHVSSTTEERESQNETSRVKRREIGGECGICLCDLKISQGALERDEHESESTLHQNHDDELVWCKATCGVNFHKQCIDQWLPTAHAPTCPTCRSDWKH